MSEQTALTVSEVLQQARSSLERIRVAVVGEISEVSDRPGYKAVYFSLCDGDAVLPCLMWRREFDATGLTLTQGALVEIEGFLTVYAAKGRLQFQVRRLALAGEGVLRMQVAALAARLQAEGLMGDERKRPLVELPERIGLVTSPRGKAVHDVLRTLERRYPLAEIVMAGVQIEGRGAVGEIVAGLSAVGEAGVDVVILCRGGGSYEDLMPFNDESVARAVIASPVPVVTGIGHEPDTSIADLVADLRASTPTAAAEAVAPSMDEVARRLDHFASGMMRGLSASTQSARHRVRALASRPVLADPYALVSRQSQRLDSAAEALDRALPVRMERDRQRLETLEGALKTSGSRVLERVRLRKDALGDRLRDLSPLGILGRGYSICFDADGVAIRSAALLEPGMGLNVRFAEGRAGCTVDSVDMEGT